METCCEHLNSRSRLLSGWLSWLAQRCIVIVRKWRVNVAVPEAVHLMQGQLVIPHSADKGPYADAWVDIGEVIVNRDPAELLPV